MKPYSVLLLYPDYMRDEPGESTFLHVEAKSPKGAVKEARKWIASYQLASLQSPDDMLVLLVLDGHHYGSSAK